MAVYPRAKTFALLAALGLLATGASSPIETPARDFGPGFDVWVGQVVDSIEMGAEHLILVDADAATFLKSVGLPVRTIWTSILGPEWAQANALVMDDACPLDVEDGVDAVEGLVEPCVVDALSTLASFTGLVCDSVDDDEAEVELFSGSFQGNIDGVNAEGEPSYRGWYSGCGGMQSRTVFCDAMPYSASAWTCKSQTSGTVTRVPLGDQGSILLELKDEDGCCSRDDRADISPVAGSSYLQLEVPLTKDRWWVNGWKATKSPSDCGTGRSFGLSCTASGKDDGTSHARDALTRVGIRAIV